MPFHRDHDRRLSDFARAMRKAPSRAEHRLWQLLRKERIDGFRFRGQFPIRGYITDFACLAAKLVIEVDGSQHVDEREYDEERTDVLKQAGFRVLRFWAHDVMKDLDAVGRTILTALREQSAISSRTTPLVAEPPPPPSPGVPGEGVCS